MAFPNTIDAITSGLLTEVLQPLQSGIEVTGFTMPDVAQCGDGRASTADRLILNLDYAGVVPDGMPRQVMLKTMLISPHAPFEMYENEVRFYRDIRPALDIEIPQVFAADYDPANGQFGLIMEDLGLRDVHFPTACDDLTIEAIKGLLRSLAKLHGKYWQSPLLESELSWVATPLKGGMSDIFQQHGYALVKDQVDNNPFKQELIAPLGITLEEMAAKLRTFQEEAINEPQTLCHGDTHIANTYLPPGAETGAWDGGLFDWQLLARGHWADDVSYVIATGLSTKLRREHERELLDYYLDLMAQQNLSNLPTKDRAFDLYRKSLMWGLFIGWLITPPVNYGEEITTANISKLVNATKDLGSFA